MHVFYLDTSDVQSVSATVVDESTIASACLSLDQMFWDTRWYWSGTVQILVMFMPTFQGITMLLHQPLGSL